MQAEQGEADERFMREALEEARAAELEGEVPIGAVVVQDGRVVARGRNRREIDHDPSAHAEFSAITAAARSLGRWRLTDCTVYVTLEPCPMCAGLMVNARVGRCVYGARDPKAGAMGSLFHMNRDARLNHSFPVTEGILAAESAELLSSFFRRRRGSETETTRADDVHARARSRAQAQVPTATTPRAGGTEEEPAAPRIVLAIDSFKGSATSAQAEAWVAQGVSRICPAARTACIPLADGGEGTVAAVHAAAGGRLIPCEVSGPLGGRVMAEYLLTRIDDVPVAVIELASAAGLGMSPRTPRAALDASTIGVGELIGNAAQGGARRIYLGLGGSCTNDGGAGLLRGLGARLLDAQGDEVADGLAGLADITSVNLAPARAALGSAQLIALCDVRAPLVGPRGALAVFGKQKGLDTEGVRGNAENAAPSLPALDAAMLRYGRALDAVMHADAPSTQPKATPKRHRQGDKRFSSVIGVPGAGAAGGAGAAVLALGGSLVPGVETILDITGFDEAVREADLVITGEGRIDEQTAQGKAPVGVARRAKRFGIPVIAITGARARDLTAVYAEGIDLVISCLREPMDLNRALTSSETRENLACAGEAAVRSHLLGRGH